MPRPAAERAEHRAYEDAGDGPAQRMIPRQHVPQAMRQTQYPLTERYLREHVIDQVRRAFGHAATAAARAHGAPLTRERHEPIEAAASATEARKATGALA